MSFNGDVLEKLIESGHIGAALGALLAKDKEECVAIGAILGAAFSSTLEANKAALQTNEPVLIASEGKLYRLYPNGERGVCQEFASIKQEVACQVNPQIG